MLFIALIAALLGSPGWLVFWCLLALLTGHKHPMLIALPLLAGLVGEPSWGVISILVIWVHALWGWLNWVAKASPEELKADSDRIWGPSKDSNAPPVRG